MAIVVMLVSAMTFLGIVSIQVQISDLTASVVFKQEAFVEFSQYRFYISAEDFLRLLNRRDKNSSEPVPEEEAFLYWPLSDDPLINLKYISTSDRVWDFMRTLRSIPGVYYESIKNISYTSIGKHDAYEGHYVPDTTKEYVVTEDFFDVENLTLLKGREPEEDDFCIDGDGIQIVPVLVGYQLRDYFEIGDIVTVKGMLEKYDPDDLKDRIVDSHRYSRGKVVGILDKSNSITTPSGSQLWNLSAGIVRMVQDPNPDDFPELKSSDDSYVYASWEQLQLLVNSKLYINRTNEDRAVEEINRALEDTGLDRIYSIERCDTYSRITAALEKNRTDSYLVVAFCVGTLCLFGLGILILILSIANAKDYAVHRLVGATKHDVALMTTVQMLILLIVSDVLIHYPYFLSKTGLFLNGDSMLYIFSGERKIYIVIAVLNMVMLVMTYIISRIYNARTDIVTTTKDKE